MTQTTPVETILDRRQMRRKITFWRLFALAAIIVAIVVAAGRLSGAENHLTPHIARIEISGMITGDRATLKLIKDAAKSRASALIVDIDSPGGTVTGSERLYRTLREAAKKKPVVAVVDNMAASGGFITALGADRVFASDNTLVGSIGVLLQVPNFGKLLDNVGVKVETFKSAPLKDAPNFFDPTSDAARGAMNALVVDSYNWFKNLVKERRKLTDAELAAVSDGRVFTGHQALALKLIDANGGEDEAKAWLEKEKGVAKGLPIRDWKKPAIESKFGLFSMATAALSAMGYPQAAELARKAEGARAASALDGLLAIWQFDAPK
ncbi:signal peptide peptidase SppA [Rhodoblastus sp.]|uniref:signal peptide peptidase SppA n=1 Tax=Rhodoblastus sp. TaxID=1962975 RepID=UPI003F9EB7CA